MNAFSFFSDTYLSRYPLILYEYFAAQRSWTDERTMPRRHPLQNSNLCNMSCDTYRRIITNKFYNSSTKKNWGGGKYTTLSRGRLIRLF
jgi:hypothetical protein